MSLMSRSKYTILFQPRANKSLKEWYPVLVELKNAGHTPVVLVDWPCSSYWIRLLESEGILLAGLENHGLHRKMNQAAENLFEARTKSREVMRKLMGSLLPMRLRSLMRLVITYRRYKKKFESVIDSIKPNVLVLPAEGNAYRRIARNLAADRGAKVLLLPFTYTDNPGQRSQSRAYIARNEKLAISAKKYETEYSLKPLFNRIVGALLPRAVNRKGAEPILQYPVDQCLAMWLCGALSSTPWQRMGFSDADLIAVASKTMRKILINDGIPEERIVVTGKPSFDFLYRSGNLRSEQASKQFNIDSGKTIVLCNIPQFYEHRLMSWEKHREEAEFILKTVSQLENVQILVTIFPDTSREEDYISLAKKYEAILPIPNNVAELMPHAHLYVCHVPSNTFDFAIACGIPVVGLDYFGLPKVPYYRKCTGIVWVEDKKDLLDTMRNALKPEEYERLSEFQRRESKNWMILDGQCSARVVSVLERLGRISK